MTDTHHDSRRLPDRRRVFSIVLSSMVGLLPVLSGCATAQLTESGRLSSYAALNASDGVLTKTRLRVDKPAVLAARSARIIPTIAAEQGAIPQLSQKQLRLVSNMIDRTLCRHLSRRFVMVEPHQSADLVVHAIITDVSKTDTTAAGLSAVTNIGGPVVSVATGVPLPLPRIPIGMGSLSIEAEARDGSGRQLAAMIWARGADAITTKARVAEEGDAHTLASEFASDFARLLITGTDPIADPTPMLPTAQGVGEYFGGKPKYGTCEQFGKHPGLGDTIGGAIGLPPTWTDDGAARQ